METIFLLYFTAKDLLGAFLADRATNEPPPPILPAGYLSFPTETLLDIMSYLDSKDYLALCLTCHRLQAVFTSRVYKGVVLKQENAELLKRTFEERPQLSQLVKQMDLSWKFDRRATKTSQRKVADSMNAVLSCCSLLEEFHIHEDEKFGVLSERGLYPLATLSNLRRVVCAGQVITSKLFPTLPQVERLMVDLYTMKDQGQGGLLGSYIRFDFPALEQLYLRRHKGNLDFLKELCSTGILTTLKIFHIDPLTAEGLVYLVSMSGRIVTSIEAAVSMSGTHFVHLNLSINPTRKGRRKGKSMEIKPPLLRVTIAPPIANFAGSTGIFTASEEKYLAASELCIAVIKALGPSDVELVLFSIVDDKFIVFLRNLLKNKASSAPSAAEEDREKEKQTREAYHNLERFARTTALEFSRRLERSLGLKMAVIRQMEVSAPSSDATT